MKTIARIGLPLALALSSAICVRAQSGADVTIVYDVAAREFECWYEGIPRVVVCPKDPYNHPDPNLHPFYQGIHFYTGQAIYLQYIGAHVGDLFAPAATGTDLAEPAVPIFGASTGLPAITKLIGPGQSVALAPGVKAVAAPRSELFNLAGTLDRLSSADFTSLIQSGLIAIGKTDPAIAALGYANSGALDSLKQVAADGVPIPTQAQAISVRVTTLMGTESPQLGWLRGRYCLAPKDTVADPVSDFPVYNERLLDLAQLISQQAALAQQAVAVDLNQKATDVVTQIKAYQDVALGVFSSKVASELKSFATRVRGSGFLQAPSTIDNVTIVNGKYAPAATGSLLDSVNAAATGLPVNNTTLGQLRDNLKVLVRMWSEIEDAIQRYDAISTYADTLKDYLASPDNVFKMQVKLNEVSRLLTDAGAAANCIAQGMPLPSPFDRPSLGTWYTSQTIALEIKRGTRLPAYDLSGIETTTQASVTRGAPGTVKAPTAGPQDASTSVAKTVFQIHNTYHFEFGAGFMRSWFHDVKYQVFQRTVMVNGASTMQNFFAQTEAHNYRFLPTANLIYYPYKREFFPWRSRYTGERHPPIYKEIGLLAGFSMSDPTKDFFFGAAWVPRAGIGIQGGIHLGFVDRMPPIPLGTTITNDVTSISQKLDHGGFIGVVMHMQVFKDVFGAIFK